jgi:hypothetical protein
LTPIPPNQPPIAVDDAATTNENTSVTILVLLNDSDPDEDPLTVIDATQGANGSVTFTGSNVTYTPNAGFSGSDSFSYTISDGRGGTDSASVSVTVLNVNAPPVAVDDTASVTQGTLHNPINVLGNDSDPDGDPLTIVDLSPGPNGSVETDGTTVYYTPAAGFVGTDSFTYTISDGNGGQDTATVTVTVNP